MTDGLSAANRRKKGDRRTAGEGRIESVQRSDISPVDQRVEVSLREAWLQFFIQLWEIATELGQEIGHRRLEGKGNAD